MRSLKNIFNSRSKDKGEFFTALTKILNFKPKTLKHYKTAFTHRSMNIKNSKGHIVNYERLEFLGDAMLSAVIAHYLYTEVPSGDEGYLTKMRSKVVSREHLNELGKDLGLIKLVKSKIPKGQFGDNIHGNLFEALVGAIYLDKGYAACEKFIENRIIGPYIDIEKLEGKVISYKSLLIEWCQKEKKHFDYNVYEDTGNSDVKHFSVKLSLDHKVVAKARATSKKKAEEKASKRAYFAFQKEISKATIL
ncbi:MULTISPECIES: ribonuclease III [Mesoflavibacter]|uniref:Ribonuclease 3 n=1 Tax=Mesoflavibacter profundi TaxID=2708110 RepID=A0ABT4S1T6_9FLAO|nr:MULTISPECIES: ribonuclease III [Mesoflavibacter]MDA0178032.1 ribonuclease III [Mesoflavibacter profundi]QIJ88993.1 Ribonuclease III [Mesoflavibacter sp. HG96]QIJ91721.1 Ribonuclease III [Mesoflavibacter sp. HG37]